MSTALPKLYLARSGDTAGTDSHRHTGRTDLLKASRGSVVNVSSVGGRRVLPDRVAYGTSKAALDYLARPSLASLRLKGSSGQRMFPATLSANPTTPEIVCLVRTPMTSQLTDRPLFAAAVLLLVSAVPAAAEAGKYLYIQTNDVREGQNAVLGYHRHDDGALTPLPGNPFYTAGTGIDNDTHGKLGPNDNDTPLIISPDCKRLFTVNTHSNTIAVFDILSDGSLRHVKGSPFPSHGIAPNSLSLGGDTLLVSNRNEDYHQLEELRGKASGSYVSLAIATDGSLRKASEIKVDGEQKPIQIHVAQTNPSIAFGADFQVDADFDGGGSRSFLAGHKAGVQGQLHVFQIGDGGQLTERDRVRLPETNASYKYLGMDGVPSLPLGIWTHPLEPILYVGFVTRNELGVFRFGNDGRLTFLGSVPNSGQDICWVLPNKKGTRLYTVNNLPRSDKVDKAATVSTYDISGDKAEKPVEIARLQLPLPGQWFRNNRNLEQPGSTAFQCGLDPEDSMLYVICQRVNQTDENTSDEGNILHSLKLDENGVPSVAHSRHLGQDGVYFRSRPQGVVAANR